VGGRGSGRGRQRIATAVAIVSTAIATAALLEVATIPFAWSGLAWASLLFGLTWYLPGRARVALFNLAFVPLTFGSFEFYLGTRPRPRADPEIPAAHTLQDQVVGHRIAPGVSVRHALWLGAEPIFDATYTIGPDGLRVVPPPRGAGDSLCVLFFVDSFVFGYGLDDAETLPWITALATGQRHRIYNFGYLGWGPHQMLALLQSGRVEEVVECAPTHVLYYGIYDHVQRAAGRSPYDPHGPRFELRGDGTLERRGNFDDAPRFAERWPLLARSEVLRILAEGFEPAPADFERFAAIVAAARDLLAARWPGARFDVLLWDKRWKQDPAFWEGLQRRGISVHFVSDLLPDYREDPLRYALGPHDGHPNALANELVARWFVREILGERVLASPR
jgi:hypothetical protein